MRCTSGTSQPWSRADGCEARHAHTLLVSLQERIVTLAAGGNAVAVGHAAADAHERFDKEVRILKFLEAHGCNFVPRLLAADARKVRIITTNCGSRVEHLDAERTSELFSELEKFGVRHDDPDIRNVTYRQSDGRFCLIDFELATILPATP